MTLTIPSIEKQVKAFCAQIGSDPLLVQGAGGNVSWKSDGVLWIKASGTWLAEAELKDIFVPVSLMDLQDAIARRDFSVQPVVTGESDLRPSIETLLHVIMPQKVVVHLHAIEILAFLVTTNARDQISRILGNSIDWIFVDYFKPGADLAKAISQAIEDNQRTEIIFLGNHGIVLGGSSAVDIKSKIEFLIQRFSSMKTELKSYKPHAKKNERMFLNKGYIPCFEKKINCIALEKNIFQNLSNVWSLYPDHLVFLGEKPQILESEFNLKSFNDVTKKNPPFIFVEDEGAYQAISLEEARLAQMLCYGEVISRVHDLSTTSRLSCDDIDALLDWDAEKYRQNVSSQRNL